MIKASGWNAFNCSRRTANAASIRWICPSMIAGVAISTRALCGRCSRASAGIRSTTRGQYCAFWNIIGACDDAIPIPSMVSLLAGELRRQLVAVRRRRDLERVDDTRQEREVVRGRRQLDQPLLVVSLPQRVENRLVDAVRAHELPGVGHDLALLCRQLGRVALRADEVDDLVAHPVAPGRGDLGRPYVRGLALAHGGQDGNRAELRVDDAIVAEEGDQGEYPFCQLWAVQQYAERTPHAPEYLHHRVDDGVVLGGDVGLTGDWSDTRHDTLLSRETDSQPPIFTPYFSRVSSRSSSPSPGASGSAMKPSMIGGRSRNSSNHKGSRVGSAKDSRMNPVGLAATACTWI